MAATLEGSNVEGARAALRSLIGTISVFEEAGKLYGRLGVDPTPLYRRNPAAFGSMVAGACFGATKTDVVCFSLERTLEPMTVPDICGNGHLLTLDNLKVDQANRRWRCRQCGRARAAGFRVRHRPAA
jgi:hypothetical protein